MGLSTDHAYLQRFLNECYFSSRHRADNIARFYHNAFENEDDDEDEDDCKPPMPNAES
jgi:hypothetical protein